MAAPRSSSQHAKRCAPFRIEHDPKLGYAIYDARDVRISQWHHDARALDHRMEEFNAMAKAKAGQRACLCCRKPFASQGIHNRLCDQCRRSADPLDPVRPYLERRAG